MSCGGVPLPSWERSTPWRRVRVEKASTGPIAKINPSQHGQSLNLACQRELFAAKSVPPVDDVLSFAPTQLEALNPESTRHWAQPANMVNSAATDSTSAPINTQILTIKEFI